MNIRSEAINLLEDLNLYRPNTDLKSLCKKLQIEICKVDLVNCDGVLLITDDQQRILVNSSVNEMTRNRFTISHEIGHYTLHAFKTGQTSFSCNRNDMGLDKQLNNKVEQEANAFASELLMPVEFYSESLRLDAPSWQSIKMKADELNVSVYAAASRYIQLTSQYLWLLVTRNGFCHRYVKAPFCEQELEMKMPFKPRKFSEWFPVSADTFFYKNKFTANKTVFVSSLGENSYGESLTLIWDKNYELTKLEDNIQDYDEDEFYERESRSRYY